MDADKIIKTSLCIYRDQLVKEANEKMGSKSYEDALKLLDKVLELISEVDKRLFTKGLL